MTFGELETYYKVYNREKWYYGGNLAFYSNANIKPQTPTEFIPQHLRPKKEMEVISQDEFLSKFRAFKKNNHRE